MDMIHYKSYNFFQFELRTVERQHQEKYLRACAPIEDTSAYAYSQSDKKLHWAQFG